MKKNTIIIVLVIAILATALCGCGKDTPSTPDTTIDTPTSTSTEENFDISLFPELETLSENIDVYRQEVSKRLNSIGEDDNFITDEEWSAITSEWESVDILERHLLSFTELDTQYEEITRYYYPVVYRTGESLVLWYTDDYGSVLLEGVYGYWNDSNYIGNLHYDEVEEETLASEADYRLTYIQETGTVNVWEFGKVVNTYAVPKQSVYCGFSYFEGYIFRHGTDVYSLNAVNSHDIEGTTDCIAHNVEYVIDADYYYGSDPWCQPLFLMTDGSIKAYIGWEGDQNSPDDISHLCDLQYEGSYDK